MRAVPSLAWGNVSDFPLALSVHEGIDDGRDFYVRIYLALAIDGLSMGKRLASFPYFQSDLVLGFLRPFVLAHQICWGIDYDSWVDRRSPGRMRDETFQIYRGFGQEIAHAYRFSQNLYDLLGFLPRVDCSCLVQIVDVGVVM